MIKPKLKFFLLTTVILLLFSAGCGDRNIYQFPNVYLYVTLNVKTDPEFMSLSAPGNSMAITKHPNGDPSIGYDNNGIIVYNNGDDYNPYVAFDRTCPNDLPESIAVDCDGSKATCPKCGSVYVLPSDGLPSIGSASKYVLKKYRTSYNPNTGELIISN